MRLSREATSPLHISSLQDWLTLSQRGLLGNCFHHWETLEDLKASAYTGWAWAHEKSGGKGRLDYLKVVLGRPLFNSDLDQAQILKVLSNFYFEEIPPPGTHRRLQGHLHVGTYPEVLYYDLSDRPLRIAKENFREAKGIEKVELLTHYLEPEDLDMLLEVEHLLEGEHVIEFTVWDQRVGLLGRHLCFWEIRGRYL